jgi:hypothetical protein
MPLTMRRRTCGSGSEAGGRRGLGPRPMALKRLTQAMATISADRRRDIYIFITAIVFIVVTYFLVQWLA